LYVLVYGWGAEKWRVIRPLAIYSVVVLLVFAPWLLRNLAFYDNPIYPLGNPTGEWDDLKAEFYQDSSNAPLKTHPVLILPIFIMPTIWGVDGAAIYGSTIGPLFLLLIPMLFLTWKELPARESLKGFLLLVLLYHLAWIVTAGYSDLGATTRFVYPMFPGMAILAAVGLDGLYNLPRKPLDFAWVLRTITALIFVLTMIAHIAGTHTKNNSGRIEGTTLVDHFVATRALEYLIGSLDEQAYLEHRLGWYALAMQAMNDLPDGARVLFLWETRSLYCDEPRITCQEDAILFNWWHARRTVGDGSAETILANWQGRGITHILVWEEGRRFEFDDNNQLC
jgi:hypothetical protein